MEKRSDIITGLWKFKDSISITELQSFAEELAKDDHYLHVYIRRASKDQQGLGVSYKAETQDEQTFDTFFENMKDVLYKRFGAGLVGWDFSSSTTTIKGF